MADVAVIGAQWGDEGKGKIVDWLSARADVVVRFQGGHNASHTLVIDGVTYKLSLLPSGVVRPGKLGVIGSGVVVDPFHFIDEIARIEAQGVRVTPASLALAENATLILPVHQELDALREGAAAGVRIGTTKRGIGPAYEDRAGRRALRVIDLALPPERLRSRVENLLAHHNALRRGFGVGPADAAALTQRLNEIAPKCCPSPPAYGACSTTSAAPASAFCSRAHRACCSMSITAPTLTSPRRTRWRGRRRPVRELDRAPSAMCSAS